VGLKTFALLVVFAVLALFAAGNWGSFMAPTNLWLLVGSIQAPLGLIMLGFIALISLMFLVFIGYSQASFLADTRRFTKEFHSLKERADNAEASRVAALQVFFESAFSEMEKREENSQAVLLATIDRLERELKEKVEQEGNSLAASIGELEDHLGSR
jgi:biopolymer transport protein ExbB/TolQ